MKRRTKIATVVSTLLVGVTTLSVGFASWVISHNAEATAGGNVTAESVTDESLSEVDFSATASSQNIHFGMTTATGSVSSPWLTNKEGINESLTATITLTVSLNVKQIDFTMTVDDTNSAWTEATNKGYVVAPTTYTLAGDGAKYFDLAGTKITQKDEHPDESWTSGTQTITVACTFAWGSHFNNKNPYLHYNSYTYGAAMSTTGITGYKWTNSGEHSQGVTNDESATVNSDAAVSLEHLDNLLKQVTGYTFSFTAKANKV